MSAKWSKTKAKPKEAEFKFKICKERERERQVWPRLRKDSGEGPGKSGGPTARVGGVGIETAIGAHRVHVERYFPFLTQKWILPGFSNLSEVGGLPWLRVQVSGLRPKVNSGGLFGEIGSL